MTLIEEELCIIRTRKMSCAIIITSLSLLSKLCSVRSTLIRYQVAQIMTSCFKSPLIGISSCQELNAWDVSWQWVTVLNMSSSKMTSDTITTHPNIQVNGLFCRDTFCMYRSLFNSQLLYYIFYIHGAIGTKLSLELSDGTNPARAQKQIIIYTYF